MAWDLWGPSHPQVELETTYFPQSEWHCDFYFGYGHDIIEENALNEKFCLEVVKRLLAKADTEIDDFKKDLVSLQSELAWAKHEEWNDICFGALSDNFAFGDSSIKNSRNKDENNIEVQSLVHTEPAESTDEKDEQCMTTKHSTNVSSIDEKTRLESFDSKLINEVVEHSFIPAAYIGTSLTPDERRSNASKMVEPADVMAKSSLIYGNGCSSEVKNSCMPILTENGCDEIRKKPSTRSQTLMSSLTSEIKATLQQTNKPACPLVKYGGQDALRQSAGIKKSNGCPESSLCASSPTECNVEQKLIDFVLQTARKVGIRKSKMTMGNKIGCPNESLSTTKNGRNQRKTVKFQGRSTDKEGSDQFTIAKETQSLKRKRKSPLSAQNVQETCFPSTEISSNTKVISKAEKEQKSKITDDNTRLNLISKKCEKLGHIEHCEDKDHGTSHGNSKTSASQLQKKRKRTPSSPLTADTRERTACLGSKDLNSYLRKKRKVTSVFTCTAEVKDLSLSLPLQDLHRDATNGSFEEDLKHPEREDSEIVEASKSQKQRNMTSTFTIPAEIKDLSLGVGMQNLHKDRDATNGKVEEDPLIVKSYSGDDSHTRNLVPYAIPTPIPSQRLMEMTVGKLKELAKRLELKNIHKLRKMELVDLLAKTQGGH
uniref:uncharacterized protein LOC101295359 isoform X2 n=1 Tax=Fragaria vesca subsp. vesca TaxID=101020 RepID=UPI0005C9E51B|nr:PREDICTED: uncharacterized protein LOC101295359 isoform X2 [Fragaria vesca subsp. vesca]